MNQLFSSHNLSILFVNCFCRELFSLLQGTLYSPLPKIWVPTMDSFHHESTRMVALATTTPQTSAAFESEEVYCDNVYNISNASTIARLVFPNATREQFVSACISQVNDSSKMSAFLSIPYAVIFLLSVVGNCLVILTLVRHKKMRTITNMYLLNLAVSDLLLAVFCMPFTLVPMMMQAFIFGNVICVMIRYLQGMHLAFAVFC